DETLVAAHEGILTASLGLRRRIAADNIVGRAMLEGRTVQIADIASLDPVFDAETLALARRHKWRASAAAPMMREGEGIGCIILRKPKPGLLSARQVELLETFAAQAVIAIENVRLFSELRQALDQQTATAEVLQTINSSPGDLQPVFDAIVDKAMTLCNAAFGLFNTYDGEHFYTVATRGIPEVYAEFRRSSPPDYAPATGPGRLVAGEDVAHIEDTANSEPYRRGDAN